MGPITLSVYGAHAAGAMLLSPKGLRPDHYLDAVVLFAVEQAIALGRFRQSQPVRDREGGIDLPLLDQVHEWTYVLVHVRLPHLEGQPLREGRSHRESVNRASIKARNGNRASLAASLDRLPQRVSPPGSRI